MRLNRIPSTLMDSSAVSTAVGLCLLPSELLHDIFCRLAPSEIHSLHSTSKSLGILVSGDDFSRLYGSGGGWIFVYKKRPPRESVLRGFNERSGRWFRLPASELLTAAVPPGEDLYFLAAGGDFFLFASNGRRELIAVNMRTREVRRIPPSPLGPRGTSSWRRSGLKLVPGPPGSGTFRFLFAEMYDERPFLFVYCSESNNWRANMAMDVVSATDVKEDDSLCSLSITHLGAESVVVNVGSRGTPPTPVVHRPMLNGVSADVDNMHVYGDGLMAIVKSTTAGGGGGGRARVIAGVELWRMSDDRTEWEAMASMPEESVVKVRKPYGVMMGCMEEEKKRGLVRVVLLSNYEGCWDLLWLYFDRVLGVWGCVPVPADTGTRGLNMAGIAISSSFGLLPRNHHNNNDD